MRGVEGSGLMGGAALAEERGGREEGVAVVVEEGVWNVWGESWVSGLLWCRGGACCSWV